MCLRTGSRFACAMNALSACTVTGHQLMNWQLIILLAAELLGLGAVGYGCWLAWHPAAFMVPGAILLALSIIADLRRDREG